MTSREARTTPRRTVLSLLTATAILVGVVAGSGATEVGELLVEHGAPRIELERIELSDEPFPEPARSEEVPDWVFRTEDEIRAERAASVDIDRWNQDRTSLGLPSVVEPSSDEINQLLENEIALGFPVFSEEIEAFKKWQTVNGAHFSLYERAYQAGQIAYGVIDEPNGTLDLWVRDAKHEVFSNPPTGVSIREVGFSSGEAQTFLDSEATRRLLESVGSIVGTDIDLDGITVYVAEGTATDREATGLFDSLSRLTSVPIASIDFVDPMMPVEDHCNDRLRCDGFNGGMSWTSNTGNCTSGFAMTLPSTGERGISTAGHCNDPFTDFHVRGTDGANAGVTAETAIPDIEAQVNSASYDMQINSGPASQEGGFVPTYYRDNSYANYPVTRILTSVPFGSEVCLSAHNTLARRCGTVADGDFDEYGRTNAIRIEWTSDCCLIAFGGDSGGPITRRYAAGTAVATHESHFALNHGEYPSDALGYPIAAAPTHLAGWEIMLAADPKRGRVESFVAGRAFRAGLQRHPSVSDTNWWSSQIDNSGNCAATARWMLRHTFFTEVAASLPIGTGNSSTNSSNKFKRLRRLYWAALNRPADSGGINWWHGQIDNQADWEWAVNTFLASGEADTAIKFGVGQEEGPC